MNMNNISYKEYLINGLESLSKNFTVKTYKLACQEEWKGFERGRDVRIQIQWKGECIWEWILENSFWVQRNTNKEDRNWMRSHADIKLNACKNATKKTVTKKTVTKKTTNNKISQTQTKFENMKKK